MNVNIQCSRDRAGGSLRHTVTLRSVGSGRREQAQWCCLCRRLEVDLQRLFWGNWNIERCMESFRLVNLQLREDCSDRRQFDSTFVVFVHLSAQKVVLSVVEHSVRSVAGGRQDRDVQDRADAICKEGDRCCGRRTRCFKNLVSTPL